MAKKKKGQSGLVSGLVFGIASLVVAVMIAFIVVFTLVDANLLQDGRESIAITNETGTAEIVAYDLAGASETQILSGSFALTELFNRTSGASVPLANATVSDDGAVTNATIAHYDNLSISYTYTLKTYEEISTDGLSGNFTEGVDQVSAKIPTVLLVAAIVLLLGVLGLLVAAWQRMRLGSSI